METNNMKCFDVNGDGESCIIVAHDADEARLISLRDQWGDDVPDEIDVSEAPMDRMLRDEDGVDKPLSWWAEQLGEPGLIASTLL